MEPVALKIQQNKYYEDLNKGEAIVYTRNSGKPNESKGLIFGCPNCGNVSTGSHKYNKEKQALQPSIVCGKCDYHGWLRQGVFTSC